MSNEPVVSEEAIKEAIDFLREHFSMDKDDIGAMLFIFPIGGQDVYPASAGINVSAGRAPEIMRWFADNSKPDNVIPVEGSDA